MALAAALEKLTLDTSVPREDDTRQTVLDKLPELTVQVVLLVAALSPRGWCGGKVKSARFARP